MKWTPREGSCVVCGEGDRADNSFYEEEFYPGVYFHLRCLNTPAGAAWYKARRAENPIFDRYWRMMTVREPITCPSCGKAMERIPKGIGMGASAWPAHCMTCHRTGPREVCPYREGEAWSAIERVMHDFVRSHDLGRIDARLRDVAAMYDHLVNGGPCACGGRFSLAATARCLRCDGAVPESWFHLFEEPLSAKQRKRLKELFGVDFDAE